MTSPVPLPAEVVRMAPCVVGPEPYATAAAAFAGASQLLPDTPFGSSLRTLVCCEMFHASEAVLAKQTDPLPLFKELLLRYGALVQAAAEAPPGWGGRPPSRSGTIAEQTGQHYGRLFSQFQYRHYYGEAFTLLRARLERNGFDRQSARGRRALDAGCGGGRYTVALRRFGFRSVVGIDFSEQGIRNAKTRLRRSRVKGVSFRHGSVLDLPFEDAAFDFVFSNGVLHHTANMPRGFRELLRVLKPGGQGFVYVIEDPGGVFWDVIELLRVLMKPVSHDEARVMFDRLGVPTNRAFYILDHVMAPINIRSRPEEVEKFLARAGASDIRRLDRGADIDRVERIHRGELHGHVKFGVGENRYFFRKI